MDGRGAGTTGGELRILLLEDSDIDAELIATHLARDGLQFALDVAAARDAFERGLAASPDVVLADYSLPGFDGLEALALSHAVVPDTPFIFVSGVAGEEFATDALQQGAVDYVTKRNLRRLPGAIRRAVAETRERLERQRAESALRESEIGARLAVDAARLGSWSFSPAIGRLSWDARCKALFGLAEDVEISGYDDFLTRIHPDDRARLDEAVRAAITPGATEDFIERYRTIAPDGAERWVESRGIGLFENGVCTRFVGVLRDVSTEKRAEEAMRERNASLEASVEERTAERDRIWQLSHDLLAVAGSDGFLVTVNPAWTDSLGYTADELLSRPLQAIVHPEDWPATREVILRLQRGLRLERFENRLRTRDGGFRRLSWTAVPEGDIFYAIGRDVTEERNAADELARTNERLREQIAERERAEATVQQMQRLEAIGQLTSGVAHDFNNLLTVVLGNLEFVERATRKLEDAALSRRLEHMRIASTRGASLTAQLLAFSRRQRLEPKPVDLNDTVANMRELLQTTMGGSVRIGTDLDADLWRALVDPTQIELIILNLAINARDAMEVGGSLTIGTSNEQVETATGHLGAGDYAVLTVTDTGTGMSKEVLAKALEPFFTTKPVGKGSGLGLAQVYGFAKQSGGGVRIDTEEGVGTSVHVYLPRVEGEVTEAPVAVRRAEVATRGETILVVDDDQAVLEVTAEKLRTRGYTVVTAGSGREALAALDRDGCIAMLVVDYAMPGMNGAEVATAARAGRPDLPVLFITGYADLEALAPFGFDSVVEKPLQDDTLFLKIESELAAARRKATLASSASRS